MKSELIQILSTNGYPVYLQGTLAASEPYPDTFFTFWNNNTYDFHSFDNEALGHVWDFDVNLYSTDPETVNELLLKVRDDLKTAGWLVSGSGYDIASDEPTHTGRGINARYIQIPPQQQEDSNE